ncbi:MAG: hypothetical protein EKK46_01325 [Rhodocyclaceae bacterium]|nr:MAG: hypothetical protein EKK46_01325 [Rhodocyclaceae bacterium]
MIERSFAFGPDKGLIGTLCLPVSAECGDRPASAGIVLFNSGIVHRIGPHRINVRLARDLARRGIPSIRFDLAGLGDSARASGEVGFEAQASGDLSAAMDALAEATGLQRFGLFGFCSGAFHSYNAAHLDQRICALLLFDAFRYGTYKSALIRLSLRFREHGVLRTVLRLSIKTLGQTVRAIPFPMTGKIRLRTSDAGFIVDGPSPSSFAQGVRHLRERGVEVSMVFAGDGFEVYNYGQQFHDALAKFGIDESVSVTFLPDIDHVATGVHAQRELIDCALDWATGFAGGHLPPVVRRRHSDSALPRKVDAAEHPPALVLSRTITGLGTIRSLGKAGIDVHAVYFDKQDPVRFSRYCKASYFDDSAQDEDALLAHVVAYARRLGNRPVVVPTCDAHALMLARHREALRDDCRIMAGDYATMTGLINKNGLYAQAALAGVKTIPAVVAPTLEEARTWSAVHPAPYLIKPFYTGAPAARLKQKNLVLQTREELLDYVAADSMEALIVQRLIRGGDGHVFDYYGYCDRDGRVVTQTSRRRWRQNIPDFGTCTIGEIPAEPRIEAEIFASSQRLLRQVHYHGIVMIEWLRDRASGDLYVIDFNARPFMGIGHLTAAGMNLPAIAYGDLVGSDISHIEQTPLMKHLVGLDLLRDIESFIAKRGRGELGLLAWLDSLLKCGYFYYFEWQDMAPGLARQWHIFKRALSYLRKKQRLD